MKYRNNIHIPIVGLSPRLKEILWLDSSMERWIQSETTVKNRVAFKINCSSSIDDINEQQLLISATLFSSQSASVLRLPAM